MRRSLAATMFLSAFLTLLAQPIVARNHGPVAMTNSVDRALRHVAASRLMLERTPIAEGVAHYQLDLQVGPDTFDVIRLHRVVRERSPWRPIRSRRAIMMAHGDGWGFEPNFLSSLATPDVPDTQNLAVFLAAHDVDVWGVDFRWALVPGDTEDLSFMADQNFGTSVGDLDIALATARAVRLFTGGGFGKMHLLGFSRGGSIGWAQLSAETQRPNVLRHVSGFVAMEHAFKTDDETLRLADCDSYDAVEALIDDGLFFSDFTIIVEIGDLATTAPNDPSPFFPILSNADLAEWIGADPGGGAIPHFHSVGGIVDPATFETELVYTQPSQWFAYLSGSASYQPLGINLEGAAISCDELDSPYDDHLADINVPVFYVGVAGAFGALGLHQTTLIGSSDVSTLIIQEAAQPGLDYGHNELFLAQDAETVVWQPVLEWIEEH